MHTARKLAERVVTAEPRSPFPEIARLMAEGDLDPTPANYELCFLYVTEGDPELVAKVDAVIRKRGRLDSDALAEVSETRPAPEDINGMIAAAHRHIEQIGGLLNRSDRQNETYGAALQTNAQRLVAGEGATPVIEDLVNLTRTMIEQSREVHAQLRETGEEVRQMRARLEEARRSAITDSLTGLPNRRALEAELKSAMQRSRSLATPFAVAICDIDHFKRFNDDHGHAIGDAVLKLVGSRLSSVCEQGGIFVSRYGGEEFVMLFENRGAAEAAQIIDKIRSDISARDLTLSGTGKRLGRLSFSAGVASLGGHRSASAALKTADAALYEAKRLGRNQVRKAS